MMTPLKLYVRQASPNHQGKSNSWPWKFVFVLKIHVEELVTMEDDTIDTNDDDNDNDNDDDNDRVMT